MLELLLCSLLTVFPDYLVRRFVQGKRIGREITIYSVWYELRYGITACLMLTVTLITMIFYFHPSTTSATSGLGIAMRLRGATLLAVFIGLAAWIIHHRDKSHLQAGGAKATPGYVGKGLLVLVLLLAALFVLSTTALEKVEEGIEGLRERWDVENRSIETDMVMDQLTMTDWVIGRGALGH